MARITKKARVHDLIDQVKQGPACLSADYDGDDMSREKLREQYRIWINSWVLPDLRVLVPEAGDYNRDANEKR